MSDYSKESLRPYQKKACNNVVQAFNCGKKSVVLVGPTGSGKTRMGLSVVRPALSAGQSVAGLVHRRELVSQLRDAGVPEYTAQSRPAGNFDLLVVDECHHYIADEWGKWLDCGNRILGLTATPERGDGQPLGNIFDHMVVSADIPELIRDGYLVDTRIIRPNSIVEGLAQDPVEAWKQHAGSAQGFVYASNEKHALKLMRLFGENEINVSCILGSTGKRAREIGIELFKKGRVRILINVHVLTEGIDVPEASVCMIARGVSNPTTYLQMVGRVMRPAPHKKEAIVIDLPGCSWAWGHPSEPRVYSLEKGIRLEKSIPVYECPRCGWAQHERIATCARCEWKPDSESKQKPPKIYSQELREVWDGADTPQAAKDAELQRLLNISRRANYSLSWVVDQMKKTFGEKTVLKNIPEWEREKNLHIWTDIQKQRGYRRGWAGVRYKRTFGVWPPRKWQ